MSPCATCQKNKERLENMTVLQRQTLLVPLPNTPVYQKGEVKKLKHIGWSGNDHKLIIFFPEVDTPVCETELGALEKWIPEFKNLGVRVFAACTDPIDLIANWFKTDELLKKATYPVLSSRDLPRKLGLLHNGRSKRASVFFMKSGEVVKQEHFMKVGRSLAELHRMAFGYSTDSYCAEGWQSPEDGFLKT